MAYSYKLQNVAIETSLRKKITIYVVYQSFSIYATHQIVYFFCGSDELVHGVFLVTFKHK